MPETDEDILRLLMVQATADIYAPPGAAAAALGRVRRRRRLLAVTATAAAAGLVGGLLTTVHFGSARLTTAQSTLYRLSDVAAVTPRPPGRYVVLAEQVAFVFPGKTVNTGQTSVIDETTGATVTYEVSGSSRSPGTPVSVKVQAKAPTVAQLDALPTSTTALRAALLGQAGKQLSVRLLPPGNGPTGDSPGPSPVVSPRQTGDDRVFQLASYLLWEPDLSPALRAALYKLLATTPGVAVKQDAKDSSGRPAVEISRVDSATGIDIETFENPKTGATLESVGVRPTGPAQRDLYLSIRYADKVPADPYPGAVTDRR